MMVHKEIEKSKYKNTIRLKEMCWHPNIAITGKEKYLKPIYPVKCEFTPERAPKI